jgi:hypothetical protein
VAFNPPLVNFPLCAVEYVMETFLCKTLSPEIFWTALAALGTLSAVLIALFMPAWTQSRRNDRLERLVRAEIDGNLQIIRNFISQNTVQLQGGVQITPLQRNMGLVTRIDLRLWHQYRFDLAADRPKSYQTFDSVNLHAEEIVNATSQPQRTSGTPLKL